MMPVSEERRREAWRIILGRYFYGREQALLKSQQKPREEARDADEKPDPDLEGGGL